MSNAEVLVVDDDPDMRATVRAIMERDGHRVTEAASGKEVEIILDQRPMAAIVLDLLLNGESGLDVAKRIRSRWDVPIVILSANDDVIDKVVCLELGVDDYITKPFHVRELSARVRNAMRRKLQALLGRAAEPSASGSRITFGSWSYDLHSEVLTSSDTGSIPLTTFEARILNAFVTQPKTVLSRDALLELTAARDWSPDDRSVDVLIARLRKKLHDNNMQPRYIKTIRGSGYMWVADM